MVLVEVHHLESVELIGYRLNLLFLARLLNLYALGVPFDVFRVGHLACGMCVDESVWMGVELSRETDRTRAIAIPTTSC